MGARSGEERTVNRGASCPASDVASGRVSNTEQRAKQPGQRRGSGGPVELSRFLLGGHTEYRTRGQGWNSCPGADGGPSRSTGGSTEGYTGQQDVPTATI